MSSSNLKSIIGRILGMQVAALFLFLAHKQKKPRLHNFPDHYKESSRGIVPCEENPIFLYNRILIIQVKVLLSTPDHVRYRRRISGGSQVYVSS